MKLEEYRGYNCKIEFSEEDDTYIGTIRDIEDVVAFDGKDKEELEYMFHETVDDYIETIKELGRE